MLAKLTTFLKPRLRGEDTKESLEAEILEILLNAMLVGTIAFFMVVLFFLMTVGLQPSRVIVPFAFGALVLGARQLLRRGHVRAGSWLLVAGMWASLTLSVIVNDGILTPAAFGYVLPVMLAAFLLGSRSTAAITALSIIVTTIMTYLAQMGQLPIPPSAEILRPFWGGQIIILLFVAILISIATQLFQGALDRSHKEVAERRRVEGQLREAKDAAESANRVKSSFLMTMSHELRTPLNAIIGFSDLLLDQAREEQREDYVLELETIRDAGKHLEEVFQDILEMSHLEAGNVTPDKKLFPIRDVVSSLQKELLPFLSKSGNQLTVKWEEEIEQICSDPEQLRHALWKILHNADKFTRKGFITLTIEPEKSNGMTWMNFRVSDTGIGIPPERLAELGKPFVQVDDSTSRKFEGTGLGLAISRGVCRLLGGELLITSEVGRGSTFTVRVPG